MDRERTIGCGCEPLPPGASPRGPEHAEQQQLADRWLWLRLGLGVVVSGQLMVLSLALNLSQVGPDERFRLQLVLLGLTAFGVALVGSELLRGWVDAWAHRRASLEAMFALAFAGGLGASLAGLVTGGPVFFEVVTVVLCVYAIGRNLKRRFWSTALARVERAGLLPHTARRLESDHIRRVDAADLGRGDVVVVYDGERLPAAGRVRAGEAWVDTAAVDGERVPRWVGPGESAPSGAAVRGGTLRVEVDTTASTELTRTRQALEDGQTQVEPSPLAATMARYFVPLVTTVALVSGTAWTVSSGAREGFMVATAVLLVACPCGFGLATPVSRWASTAWLASRGVQVRDPACLESLAQATMVVLDKTGTLTDLAPSSSELASRDVGRWVGAVQQWFDHPVARLLWRGGADAPRVRGIRTLLSGGVRAEVLDDHGAWRSIVVEPAQARRDLLVSVDGVDHGILRIEEQLRPGVPGMLRSVSELGVEVRILTGDTVDLDLGVPFEGGATPADKATRVAALRDRGPVVFVGDRPNDLAAMARADVAITIPGASPLVAESAGIILDGIERLPDAIRGARAARDRLRRLLVFSLTTNAVGIAIAAAGLLHPVLAAVIMAGTSLTVTMLALPTGPLLRTETDMDIRI